MTLVLPPDEETDGGVMRLVTDLSRSDLGTQLTARWTDTPGLGLDAVAGMFGIDLVNMPRALVPTFTELDLSYTSSTSHLLLAARTPHNKVAFALLPQPSVPAAAAVSMRSTP
ncbi:hypothetical protein [Streptomyces olivoreticuli]|uniref:hypothetical protein n=1 Tax=Streptomyces olivoreticuli TaxID=68246 RepID=UPI000E27CE5D|nr:hypothetical protein [Streptomyces olivoreticuli]